MFELKLDRTTGAFAFDTDVMAGRIETAGAYHGVRSLIDKRTGRQLIHPDYSALNLFRLFAQHQAMGQPRFMARVTSAGPDAVEIRWPPTAEHQVELVASYTVPEAEAIDLQVTVRSEGTYAGYELFLPSYFDPALRPRVYLRGNRYGEPAGDPDLVVPMVNDVYRGTVLVFARDPHAARRCVDGRWNRSEADAPTVQMCPVRYYAHCLAFLTDPDEVLAAALMARPRDCYAISARYFAENEADRIAPYSAFDLSLFGNDLVPGDEVSVGVRLALLPIEGDLSRPLQYYRAFAEATSARRPGQVSLTEC